jgi:ABC-type transporter Mla subunit MlaD
MYTQLENLNKQIRISDVISVLMAQSTQLLDIVNKNQKEVNRLKEELEQLKTHTDNATDQIAS